MSELTQRTIYEHAEALRKKEYSSVQLTQAYLEEIDRKDKTIGAYITVTAERALERADLQELAHLAPHGRRQGRR